MLWPYKNFGTPGKRVCASSKIIFIESPSSVAGNAMNRADIELILNNFNGLVVIDETYVNFSRQKSFVTELGDYPNLIILQNFDKFYHEL